MKKCFFIAAGGTGGHIFPALALAAALKQAAPDVEIIFVGSNGGMEEKIIPPKGFKLLKLHISRLHHTVGIFERLKTLFLLPIAIFTSAVLLLKYRPQAVLGVGGHASGPLLLAASLLRFQTFIWEPHAHPGLANRILSRFVGECMVVFDEAIPLLKSKNFFKTGMPIRKEIESTARVNVPSRERPTRVFVFGGSLGARPINNAFSQLLIAGGDWLKDFEFVHQTGSLDYPRISAAYKENNVKVECLEFVHNMHERYAWADLTISRSGTGTLFELAAAKKAAVLIPLPTASDDHQRKNADALSKDGAGITLLQKDLTPEKLKSILTELKNDPSRVMLMATAIQKFHKADAAMTIAKHIQKSLDEEMSK